MATGMEVDGDPPPLLDGGCSTLKRSNSAPMINMLDNTTSMCNGTRLAQDDSCKPTVTSSFSTPNFFFSNSSNFKPLEHHKPRVRHSSYNGVMQSPNSNHVSTPIKGLGRIHQIKREEEVHKSSFREISHEREVQSAMQISQSWDEHFTLDDQIPPMESPSCKGRPRSLSESLHIFTAFPASSSPSPTRVGKQCFSPSMQAPVNFNGHNFNFSPSPTPSPTRRVSRRSVSPIVMKPSALSLKRKLDSDCDSGFSQPKRIFSGSLLAPATLSITTQATQTRVAAHGNMSSGSFDDSQSEHSSAGTNGSNATSTPFSFSMLANDNCSIATDSESEMSDTSLMNNNNHER